MIFKVNNRVIFRNWSQKGIYYNRFSKSWSDSNSRYITSSLSCFSKCWRISIRRCRSSLWFSKQILFPLRDGLGFGLFLESFPNAGPLVHPENLFLKCGYQTYIDLVFVVELGLFGYRNMIFRINTYSDTDCWATSDHADCSSSCFNQGGPVSVIYFEGNLRWCENWQWKKVWSDCWSGSIWFSKQMSGPTLNFLLIQIVLILGI